jgi:hypothetical protein
MHADHCLLFEWGQTWLLDPSGTRVLTLGTPVFIVERYDFHPAPPWRSLRWLSTTVEVSSASMTDLVISGDVVHDHRLHPPAAFAKACVFS